MNSAGNAIDLLIIEPSLNRADGYVSTLRNAGMAIHPTHIGSSSELDESLFDSPVDLIICSANGDPGELKIALAHCQSHHANLPLILVYQDQEPEILLQAMRDGVRDVVAQDDNEHLVLVVTREYSDLVTRRRLAGLENQLRESEARCSTLIEHSRDAIAYIHEGMHVHANPVYLEMFGYVEMDDIEGLPILDMIAPADLDKFKRFLRSNDTGQQELEVKCQDSDGQAFDAILEFSPASIDGEPCTQIIIRNSADNSQLEQQLQQLSTLDPLTGLANRSHFISRLEEISAETLEAGNDLSLLYLSIDDFKVIRTTSGIAASDALLKEFAEVLQQAVTDHSLLARFGDHSFTLLSKNTLEHAETQAEQLFAALRAHLFESAADLPEPACSIGIATFDPQSQDSLEFINRAYQACDSARSTEGHSWSLYNQEEMESSFGDHQGNETHMVELIRDALDRDRFRQVYQPIVSLQGESREVYAVLTRLIDNNDEEILPNHFMKDAEQEQLMAEIDRWVIKHAITELVDQRKGGKKVCFFISLSSASVQDSTLLLWICDCVRELKAKGAWLTFQIRESDIRNNIQKAKQLIDGLAKITCQIAIDQYSGSSKSEALLKHLQINYVKFDATFLEDIDQPQKQDKLRSINRQVQHYNVKTIAMGVEDANSLAALWTVGLNYIQGYFLQEPSEYISYEFAGP